MPLLYEASMETTTMMKMTATTIAITMALASLAQAQPVVDIDYPPSALAPAPTPAPIVLQQAPRLVPLRLLPPASDPARTRLGLFPSAEVLHRGEVEFTCRGLLLTEIAVGATDWLQFGLKTSPLLLVIPDGYKVALFAGGLRARLLKTRLFTLTVDADGLTFLGWAGIRAGASVRIGNDRFAAHGSASGLKLWQISDVWASDTNASKQCVGCANTADTSTSGRPTTAAVLVSGGVDVRVHRKVKLLVEGSYYRDSMRDVLMVAPAVRLHGHHFATDLGLGLVHTASWDKPIILPLVNMSVTF
jgi:hypothetical protein